MTNSIYHDDSLVEKLTRESIQKTGSQVLQIDWLDPDENTHLSKLLTLYDIPLNAKVLDMACGTGIVAHTWNMFRPDLSFTLNNISPSQLAFSGRSFPVICSSADETGLPDNSFDAITIQYALGHLDLNDFIEEVSRLLVPGGIFCLYDLFAYSDKNNLSQLGYQPINFTKGLIPLTKKHGLQLDVIMDVDRNLQPWHASVGITPELLKNTHTLFARFLKV